MIRSQVTSLKISFTQNFEATTFFFYIKYYEGTITFNLSDDNDMGLVHT